MILNLGRHCRACTVRVAVVPDFEALLMYDARILRAGHDGSRCQVGMLALHKKMACIGPHRGMQNASDFTVEVGYVGGLNLRRKQLSAVIARACCTCHKPSAAAVPRVVILRCPRASHNPERATTSARASKDAARPGLSPFEARRARARAERLRMTVQGMAFVTQTREFNSLRKARTYSAATAGPWAIFACHFTTSRQGSSAGILLE